jgi:Fur family transcriptional regulator, ferric uptake regulator
MPDIHTESSCGTRRESYSRRPIVSAEGWGSLLYGSLANECDYRHNNVDKCSVFCGLFVTKKPDMNSPKDPLALVDELASRGIRLTRQRRAVIEALEEAKEHLDAASLLDLARKREPSLNRATVYRVIELLKGFGLLDELELMHLGGEKHYYEVRTRHEHGHLTCVRCGRVEEFVSPLVAWLRAEITNQTGFDIRAVRLELGGHCRSCAGSAKPYSIQKRKPS